MPVEAISIASSRRDNGCGASFDWNDSEPERNVPPDATLRDRRPKIASHNGYSRAALKPPAEFIAVPPCDAHARLPKEPTQANCSVASCLSNVSSPSLRPITSANGRARHCIPKLSRVEVALMHVRRRNVFAHSLMLTAVIGTTACGGG